MKQTMIANLLEITGNRLLEFDPGTAERLGDLEGKVFKLEFLIIDQELYFIPSKQGLQIKQEWSGPVDITVRGSPLAFAQFGLKQQGVDNKLFVDKRVSIEGDAELAQDFQKLIRELDIDFEELLSRFVGDVAAHQIGRGLNALRDWSLQSAESIRLNIQEYMVEEARILAPGWRVDKFIEEADALRADVERLEQRVRRLMDQTG